MRGAAARRHGSIASRARTSSRGRVDEVVPALERVRAAVAAGAHAAGYLAYEAGHALDPKLAASAREGDGPLLSFGLFDGFDDARPRRLLPRPRARSSARRGRASQRRL